MKILIAAGSSGGHIFPAIATAFKFRELDPAAEVFFVGSTKQIDSEIFGREGYGFATLSAKKQMLKDMLSSFNILQRFRPDVAVGFGGYCSFPVLAIAKMMGLPTIVHEQNYVPGLANRILSGFVDRVAVSFKETNKFLLRKDNIRETGNPIRLNLVKLDRKKAAEGLGLAADTFTVLVMGGSQGARAINRAVLDMLRGLGAAEKEKVQFIHLTGIRDFESVKLAYEPLGVAHRVFSFCDRMNVVYSAADIAVSRAGATSLAELMFFGLASVLIPYPAKKVHQPENAQAVAAAGAAVVIQQKDLSARRLWDTISGLIGNNEALAAMRQNAQRLARPGAAGDIAGEIKGLFLNKAKQI